jgi:translation initiation factor IF-3
MQTEKALALAQQFNLDLVEVAPNAVPPVCRIMDFGKYVYEEQKKASHVKSTASKLKEIEFSARIAENDFHTKIRHAEEFLDHGNKVKLRLKFRGREMAHTEIGFQVIKNALMELSGMGHPDSEPKLLGKQINVMLTPFPPNKRKRKYTIEPDEQPIDDTGSDAGHDDEDDEKA